MLVVVVFCAMIFTGVVAPLSKEITIISGENINGTKFNDHLVYTTDFNSYTEGGTGKYGAVVTATCEGKKVAIKLAMEIQSKDKKPLGEPLSDRGKLKFTQKGKQIPAIPIYTLNRMMANEFGALQFIWNKQRMFPHFIVDVELTGVADNNVNAIVMTYYENGDLHRFKNLGGSLSAWDFMDEREIVDYAIQIIHMLIYLDENNMQHRDFKPANLLIDNDGKLTVADFGTANYDKTVWGPNDVLGTETYMHIDDCISFQGENSKGDFSALVVMMVEFVIGTAALEAKMAKIGLDAPAEYRINYKHFGELWYYPYSKTKFEDVIKEAYKKKTKLCKIVVTMFRDTTQKEKKINLHHHLAALEGRLREIDKKKGNKKKSGKQENTDKVKPRCW